MINRSRLARFLDTSTGAACTLVAVIGILAILASWGLTDEKGAAEHLRTVGYQPVSFRGYGFLACGQDDLWRTKFVAIAPNGQRVRVAVCEGIFKGATIRLIGAE